ncbi:MAG: protein kinase, partial [candidate division Zixibacteria bacterium]|nr:protein kinase [candidate division Zixibacteria bacterium]
MNTHSGENNDDVTKTFAVGPNGPLLGRYKIQYKLGSGGMGDVYAALDPDLDRLIAIKVLPPIYTSNPEFKARLMREAKAAARLHHPNIVTVYEVGELGGTAYIALELVDGVTLKDKLKDTPPELAQVLDWTCQIGEGLSEAHTAGVIHRDIKPSNILLDKKGRIRILDFGLAKASDADQLTQAGSTLGTAGYMAPEQVRGETVNYRADIFSLGVVLYELLTGKSPFVRDNAPATMYAIVHSDPAPLNTCRPGIPSLLQMVVDRALAKSEDARYQSVADMIKDLRKVQTDLTGGPVGSGQTAGPSIAVLPLVDMSPQRDQEYFCDGIAEEIINALTRVQGLRVVSRTSAFQFKGKSLDVRDIGLRLGVTAVLEGSVRKSGDKIRIAAQLISVADGMHLWSEKYDRDTSDLFEIQDDIARTLVDTLTSKLVGGSTTLVRQTTTNLEAYNLYLQGRFFWNQRTHPGLTRALDCFEKALALDPEYVLAYVGLADALFILFAYNFVDPHTAVPRARIAVEAALKLDEKSAEAYTTLAGIQAYHDWDWKTAEQSFLKALELNPGYATAQHWYAELLALTGRFDQAEARFLKALEVDPLSYIINTMYGCFLFRYGQTDKAIERLSNVVKLNSHIDVTLAWLGFALLEAGRKDDALAMLDRCVEITGRNPYAIGMRGHGRALAGDREAAQKAFNELKAMPPSTWIPPTILGVLAWDLDLHSEAYRWFLM